MKDDVFAVIADPTRRHILQALAVERLAVGELVEELGVSQPTVSKHLKVLRTAGLVETEAVGQKRFYSLTPSPLARVTTWAQALLEATPTGSSSEKSADAIDVREAAEPQEAKVDVASQQGATTENIALQAAAADATAQQDVTSTSLADVPHPKTAGITFTPLTPFTPLLDNRVTATPSDDGQGSATYPADENTQIVVSQEETPEEFRPQEDGEEKDVVSQQVRQLAQNLSLDGADAEPISFRVPTPQQIIAQETALQETQNSQEQEAAQEATLQAVAEAQERAQATELQAQGQFQAEDEPDDDRGLLAKLTRWGRRSSR